MSLVIAEFTPEYVVFGCDQRKTNGTEIKCEDYRKIFKINDECIIGFAGNILDLGYIIGKIVSFSNTENNEYASINSSMVNKSYTEINSIMKESYNEIRKCIDEYGGSDDKYNRDIFAFILLGGIESGSIKLDYYVFEKGKAIDNHLSFPPEDCKFVCIGDGNIHMKNFSLNSAKYSVRTIRNFKNAFQDTLDQGVKFDNTINNLSLFEHIRLKLKR